jgi:hypothetical protein
MRTCMSIPLCAGQPLCAAGAGKEAKLSRWQSDEIVAILSDGKVAGEREFECAGRGRAGYGGDHWFGHACA